MTRDTSPYNRLHTFRLFLPEARSSQMINESNTNLRPVKLYAFQNNVAQ